LAGKLTQSRLKKEFTYDPLTGVFIRKATSEVSGCLARGYLSFRIGGQLFLAHRLAWLFVYGEFPKEQLDHINHSRADNRIANLREVSNQDNSKNSTMYKNNTSGVVGVTWDKRRGRWKASICIDYKTIHLGRFSKFSEAVDARKLAEVAYGFHENHGSKK